MHSNAAHATVQGPSPTLAHMDDGSASGWAGLIAGAVYLSAQMMFVTVVRQDSPWVPLQRISALLLGPDALSPPGEDLADDRRLRASDPLPARFLLWAANRARGAPRPSCDGLDRWGRRAGSPSICSAFTSSALD